jgi:mRNA interferase HigB
MKVHLIRKETIETFALQNAQSRTALEDWLEKLRNADWKNLLTYKQYLKLLIC